MSGRATIHSLHLPSPPPFHPTQSHACLSTFHLTHDSLNVRNLDGGKARSDLCHVVWLGIAEREDRLAGQLVCQRANLQAERTDALDRIGQEVLVRGGIVVVCIVMRGR